MSRCIINQILCCGSRFTTSTTTTTAALPLNYYFLTSNYWRCYSRRNNKDYFSTSTTTTSNNNGNNNNNNATGGGGGGGHTLGQTTILVQQGCDIQELPVIMRKIGQDEIVSICSTATKLPAMDQQSLRSGESGRTATVLLAATPTGSCSSEDDDSSSSLIIVIDGKLSSNSDLDVNSMVSPTSNSIPSLNETNEILKQLEECVTTTGILTIIDTIVDRNLTPEIAVYALDKLLRMESIINLKLLDNSNEIYMKIIHTIVKDGDNRMLLDTLDILKMFLDLSGTVQCVCDELLIRNSNEILSIIEICESIERFVDCKQNESAEKFWCGIADQEKSITDVNIKFIYKILPKLKTSRRMVLGVLERKISNVYWQMQSDAVVEIMESLLGCQRVSAVPMRTMTSLARWLNTNIHAISETQLETICKTFTALNYTDQQIEKAIERYVKAKGVKIKSNQLIANILEYTVMARIRNPHILNGCCEYFTMNSQKLPPTIVKWIMQAMGLLNYQPVNHQIQFWKQIEYYLDVNFERISTEDIIEILLNCVYLEKYPINFVHRVFNPYFLDKMHATIETIRLEKLRNDLKLFDTAMTLECTEYKGPLLPKNLTAKSIWQDGRIKRIVNSSIEQLAIIAGGTDRYSKCIVLQQLPFNPLYVIDFLIHPTGLANIVWNYNHRTDRNVYVAVLIMLPEYYDSNGEHLNGAQTMRIRHLRQMGLRVATVQYDTMAKLKVHSKELHKYLVERMCEALPCLPIHQ